MGLSRRQLLTLLATPFCCASFARTQPRLLSAYGTADKHFGWLGFTTPKEFSSLILPDRGHTIAVHPERIETIAIARRPGTFALQINLIKPGLNRIIAAQNGRHFYGNGVFNQNGQRFLTAENDFAHERSVIGIRDTVNDYRYIGEWQSQGIGPHELVLSHDGTCLYVANGGILTHPDSGRAKLNLNTMQPSLVKLDAHSGQLLDGIELGAALSLLSIRHLAISAQNDVVFGMQYQGGSNPDLPLVGICYGNGKLTLLKTAGVLKHGYIGSIALDRSQNIAASSAPRDNKILFWQIASGRLLAVYDLADGCGIAAAAELQSFWLSSGLGHLHKIQLQNEQVQVLQKHQLPLQWDNHLTAYY